MATYAIGDIQGCYKTFRLLLQQIGFNKKRDRLFLAGDLVNRGPRSLDVLKWICDLDTPVVCVLGNHDLHLIALSLGVGRAKYRRSLDPILENTEGEKLIFWLRRQPLLHCEEGVTLSHAGLLPCWSTAQSLLYAEQVQSQLVQDPLCQSLLQAWYLSPQTKWDDSLKEPQRSIMILNAFTRMRMCLSENELEFDFTDHPKKAPAGLTPWYAFPNRESSERLALFGHWASLGFCRLKNAIALDSGCVWGGKLSAYRLEDGSVFSENSVDTPLFIPN